MGVRSREEMGEMDKGGNNEQKEKNRKRERRERRKKVRRKEAIVRLLESKKLDEMKKKN